MDGGQRQGRGRQDTEMKFALLRVLLSTLTKPEGTSSTRTSTVVSSFFILNKCIYRRARGCPGGRLKETSASIRWTTEYKMTTVPLLALSSAAPCLSPLLPPYLPSLLSFFLSPRLSIASLLCSPSCLPPTDKLEKKTPEHV